MLQATLPLLISLSICLVTAVLAYFDGELR
jgi:hypothetical protein